MLFLYKNNIVNSSNIIFMNNLLMVVEKNINFG